MKGSGCDLDWGTTQHVVEGLAKNPKEIVMAGP